MFRIIALGVLLAGLGLALNAAAQPKGETDDPIARLLRQSQTGPDAPPPAANLPEAPAKAPPPAGAGPSPGSNAGTNPPIVLSARIGEHEDRTRFVIELSDPVNLRTFTLTNPDRVVMDMPEVSWRLGAPPRPSAAWCDQVLSLRHVPQGQFADGDRSQPAGQRVRGAGASALPRFRLPGGDRSFPDPANQVRRRCGLARRSESARSRRRAAQRACRRRRKGPRAGRWW